MGKEILSCSTGIFKNSEVSKMDYGAILVLANLGRNCAIPTSYKSFRTKTKRLKKKTKRPLKGDMTMREPAVAVPPAMNMHSSNDSPMLFDTG